MRLVGGIVPAGTHARGRLFATPARMTPVPFAAYGTAPLNRLQAPRPPSCSIYDALLCASAPGDHRLSPVNSAQGLPLTSSAPQMLPQILPPRHHGDPLNRRGNAGRVTQRRCAAWTGRQPIE